ncbi:GumC family protein [Desulfobulbus propionicus]
MNSHEQSSDYYSHAYNYAASPHLSEELEDSGINVLDYLRALYRRKFILLGVFTLVLVCVALYLSQTTPLYTSETQLTLDLRKTKVTNFEDVVSGLSAETSVIGTEMDILRSSSLIGRMVDKLGLIRNPTFNPNLNSQKQANLLEPVLLWVKSLWSGNIVEELSEEEINQLVKRSIIEQIQGMLTVQQRKQTNTITVSITSADPKQAAQFANTLAELYLNDQLEAKFDATKQANEWLANRLESLKAEVQKAEQAVNNVREQGKIVQTKGGGTILDQRLNAVNGQLLAAQLKTSQADARLRGAREMAGRSGAIESLGEVLQSAAISQLKSSENEFRRKKAELNQRYGPKHPQVIQADAEIKEIRSKLQEEVNRIVQSLENEVRTARAAETTLQRALADLQVQAGETMNTEVQLRELERQADSSRTLYQTFLARFQETKMQEDLQRPDARIISPAVVAKTPSKPKKKPILLLGVVGGLMLGVGCVYLLETLDRGFRTSAQVERTTGYPVLGVIPQLSKEDGIPVDYAIQKPFSSFSESLRAIRNAIHLVNVDRPPKTIMVTSSLPSEGKSTFCGALGRLAAASGAKVLLIDADLRRPSLHKMFKNLQSEIKIEDVLQHDMPPTDAIVQDPESKLYIMFAHGKTPLAAELLRSQKMKTLLQQLEEEFDLIIFDTPPIMGISDSWNMARMIDAVIYIVQWAETPRETVKTALRQLDMIGVTPSGLVLSIVNMQQQRYYGYGGYGYYYNKYRRYYNN